jgi:hypothetical protein
MPAKKKKAAPLKKLREGGFEFHVYAEETQVFHGRKNLGTIVGMKESSGRHCFRLGFDKRRQPRTYRGRQQAAEALRLIDRLVREAEKQKLSAQQLIVRSWDAKPHASPSQLR